MGASSSHNMAGPVIVNATAKHTASVIFLHGLGDTGHGWSQAFHMIKEPHIRYVFPTAGAMEVSLNYGMKMTSWFDIKGLSPHDPEDEPGIRAAASLLEDLVSNEVKMGIPRNRVMVGGFSQGGAVALYSALTSQNKSPLAGILALSTWLPLHKTFPQAMQANKDVPILQCHGEDDPVVSFSFGRLTADALTAMACGKHEFKSYKGLTHGSSQEELRDVKEFVKKVLPTA